ncbi:hypothetical protein D3C75_833650 [compost metagenome]
MFGSFEIKNEEGLIDELNDKVNLSYKNNEVMKNIVELKASEDEFRLLYDYSIDFVDDLMFFCKTVLGQDDNDIIEILTKISKHYPDSYEQIKAEIEYLQIQK